MRRILAAFLIAAAAAARAAELYSNGTGGGRWSEAATWRNSVVPGADDVVVIGRRDVVIFDRDDSETTTCHELYVDPGGTFKFIETAGRYVACVSGLVESYGNLRMDGSKSRNAYLELRLTGSQRKLALAKGAAMVVSGRTDTDDGKPNVALTAHPADSSISDPSGVLEVVDGSGLDLRRTLLDNMVVSAGSIDNTGAEFNERLNITECLFTGWSRIYLSGCDTALVADNHFRRETGPALSPAAIYTISCSLPEIRGNTIHGAYNYGIFVYASIDSVVLQNTMIDCPTAIYLHGTNAMVQQSTIRNSQTGVMLNSMTGAVDGLLTEGCRLQLYQADASVQISNWEARGVAEGERFMQFQAGQLTLLNCNIPPAQLELHPSFHPREKDGVIQLPMIQAMYFLVVGVKGKVPAGAMVEVKTAGSEPAAAGAADLNVRNAPAQVLRSGLTPLPTSFNALVVKAWEIGVDGAVKPAPTYQVTVLAPTADTGELKALGSAIVTPDAGWYRASQQDASPTVEITLP